VARVFQSFPNSQEPNGNFLGAPCCIAANQQMRRLLAARIQINAEADIHKIPINAEANNGKVSIDAEESGGKTLINTEVCGGDMAQHAEMIAGKMLRFASHVYWKKWQLMRQLYGKICNISKGTSKNTGSEWAGQGDPLRQPEWIEAKAMPEVNFRGALKPKADLSIDAKY